MQKGEVTVPKRQILRRCGTLPQWAVMRLEQADTAQLEAWSDALSMPGRSTDSNPEMTQRELAESHGVNLGKTNEISPEAGKIFLSIGERICFW